MPRQSEEDAWDAFTKAVPAERQEDVMLMIAEAASGWGSHECVNILDRDRRDAVNVRAHGIITLDGEKYRFIVRDGNWDGTVLEDWEGDNVFEPLPRTVWALQPKPELITNAILSGNGPFLLMKWDAMLQRPGIAKIPADYSYDRMMQPGGMIEGHYRALADKHHFVLVDKETADGTRAQLAKATKPAEPL